MTMSISIPLALLLEEAPKTTQEGPTIMLPFMAILGVFYFLLIRPESKRRKEHEQLLSNLGKGDTVLSNGGIVGTVVAVKENLITLQVADGVRIKIVRNAIQGIVDPKTGQSPANRKGGKGEKADSEKEASAEA